MTPYILVLNCGSSSIKFAIFDLHAEPARKPRWSGRIEGIGGPSARFLASDAPPVPLALGQERPYREALQQVRSRVRAHTAGCLPAALAHRVVHGGERYTRAVRVDAATLEDLRALVPLAPLHQPFAVEAIGVLLEELPSVPQVACFDTAFHHTLPEVERLLPLPRRLAERGLRRYGFHGLSYEYLATALPERHGDAARGRTLVAHLGSGASLCAMHDLRSVATTMGFSGLDGLMMGTRTGALDPGVILHLLQAEKLDAAQLEHLLYRESGLLGVSGLSADPRVLLAAERTDAAARAALDLYVRRVVREAGALTAVLGGLDMLAFTAGVGENSPVLRERICDALGWLGVDLDPEANRANAPLITRPSSRVRVAVEPTNEEWVAARHAVGLLAPHLAA